MLNSGCQTLYYLQSRAVTLKKRKTDKIIPTIVLDLCLPTHSILQQKEAEPKQSTEMSLNSGVRSKSREAEVVRVCGHCPAEERVSQSKISRNLHWNTQCICLTNKLCVHTTKFYQNKQRTTGMIRQIILRPQTGLESVSAQTNLVGRSL